MTTTYAPSAHYFTGIKELLEARPTTAKSEFREAKQDRPAITSDYQEPTNTVDIERLLFRAAYDSFDLRCDWFVMIINYLQGNSQAADETAARLEKLSRPIIIRELLQDDVADKLLEVVRALSVENTIDVIVERMINDTRRAVMISVS